MDDDDLRDREPYQDEVADNRVPPLNERTSKLAAETHEHEQDRHQRRQSRRLLAGRLTGPLLAFLGTLAVGTVGYMLIEGWSLNDSFYMVAMTVTTVGFSEVNPLSDAGRLFTVGLIFGGVVLV